MPTCWLTQELVNTNADQVTLRLTVVALSSVGSIPEGFCRLDRLHVGENEKDGEFEWEEGV